MRTRRPFVAGSAVFAAVVAALALSAASAAAGPWFSDELLAPRLGQPALRTPGESFTAYVALGGTFAVGDVTASLAADDGAQHAVTTVSITARSIVPGNDLDVMLYATGLSTVQEIVLQLPAGTPAGFYGISIGLSGTSYASVSAVRVYDAYPGSWGFLHATDAHVGYVGSAYSSLARLQAFVREANFLNPELVVITGDLCDDQNAGHDWPSQFLGAVAGLRVPVYVVPGNHDYYNNGESYNSGGPMRYFQEINRFENSVVTLGGARFYGVTTQYDHGLLQLYRCHGPSTEGLTWIQSDLAGPGSSGHPRFLLMHGPNYDRWVWNTTNTAAVRDLMTSGGFALALAGHTHRFETYRNTGSNSFGRDDYASGSDWGRDVAFPGFPLHVQTSALGKAEGEDKAGPADPADAVEPPASRGPYGSRVCWRWVQVDGTDVAFFTADTDGDGYRSTETPWDLGNLTFSVQTDGGGVITSSVTNQHRETWHGVRHYVPADPEADYDVEGGTLVRRLPDGSAVVAVESVAPLSVSTVVLTPRETGVADGEFAVRLRHASPNPFNPETHISFELPRACRVTLDVRSVDGRRVATLVDGPRVAGAHSVVWRGRDDAGAEVASGVYFVRLSACGREARGQVTLVK
ncbi:MAG: metallophosphoesterase [Candidatus Eisenbacteria bacterium]|nr:metallophosphoesterase [Candidatus Eisenbacteria bacterium]